MHMKPFAVGEAIRFGWETFKKRPWFFIWTMFVFNLLSNFNFNTQSEDAAFPDLSPWMIVLMVIAGIVLTVVAVLANMARNRFLLKAQREPEAVGFQESWKLEKFWRFLFAGLLKGGVIGIPALVLFAIAYFTYPNMLLLVPCVALGFAWIVFTSIRLMFVELIVMDTDMTAVQSLRESERITRGEFWHLVVFGLALGGVMILGLLALVVGLLVAVPVTSLAFVHVYRALKAAPQMQA